MYNFDNDYPVLDLSSLSGTITKEQVDALISEQGINIDNSFNCYCGENIDNLPNVCFCNTCIGEIYLPYKGCIINQNCFESCHFLYRIVNLNKVTSIGSYAFSNSGLTGEFWIDCCTSLGEYAFQNSHITKVVLSPNLASIPAYCFYDCDDITEVINLNKVTSIGNYAFAECSLSGEIWIDSCTSLGNSAFHNTLCTKAYIPRGLIYDRYTFPEECEVVEV